MGSILIAFQVDPALSEDGFPKMGSDESIEDGFESKNNDLFGEDVETMVVIYMRRI